MPTKAVIQSALSLEFRTVSGPQGPVPPPMQTASVLFEQRDRPSLTEAGRIQADHVYPGREAPPVGAECYGFTSILPYFNSS